MKSIPSFAAFAAVLLAVAVLATAPAAAQTGSLWHNQKLNDMKTHDRESAYDSRANEFFQMGLQYMSDLQRLLKEDDRSPRQEKKLDKTYRKAVKNFESAIDTEPEWLDPRVMLGSIHYKMKDYPAAKAAYESALAIDPEHADVQAYLSTVQWYMDHPEAEQADAESSGGGGS